jgi:hypothetical protein
VVVLVGAAAAAQTILVITVWRGTILLSCQDAAAARCSATTLRSSSHSRRGLGKTSLAVGSSIRLGRLHLQVRMIMDSQQRSARPINKVARTSAQSTCVPCWCFGPCYRIQYNLSIYHSM